MYINNTKNLEKNQELNANEKFREKKINNMSLASVYQDIYGNTNTKALRVRMCSTELSFKKFEDDSLKLVSANFCKVRLCPMCSWRRSLKIYGQVSKIVDELEKKQDYQYLFLTLTVKNCDDIELVKTIDNMFLAFNKLMKRKDLSFVLGFHRSLEITYNRDTDEYHPHFHVLLLTEKSYFNTKGKYVTQARFTDLWEMSLKASYKPVVNVKKVKKTNTKVIAEMSKYSVKSADYLILDDKGDLDMDISKKVVYTLDLALKNRRLSSFGGKFKELHKKLNLSDAEDGDLVNTDNENEIREDIYELVTYVWNKNYKNYIKLNKE